MPTLAEQSLDAIYEVSGRHPGYRATHARGTFCKGTFEATAQAGALTTAVHMQGNAVDATVRFSNGSGDPRTRDGEPDARGMAVKLDLPGSSTDIVAVNLPCFFTRTPQDFIELTRISKPGRFTRRPPMRKLLPFLLIHREAFRATRAALLMKPVPSYAHCRYNALHAFRWIDAEGVARYVRYSWLPEAGERALSRRKAKRLAPDYLRRDLTERLAAGPIRFALQLQLAAAGDPVDDPTAVWPEERETVAAGTLTIAALAEHEESSRHLLVFDPMRLPDGIGPGPDQILAFRPHAYALSAERRSAGHRL